jgi:hypothetical protein
MNIRRLYAVPLLLVVSAMNAGAQTIDGDWQGTLSAGPVELKVILHLAADGQGGFKASLDSPDQGAKAIPVTSVRFADSALTFEVPPIGGSYSGKADAAVKTITGSWSQGGMSAPLAFTRFVAAAASRRVPKPSDIDGDWEGALSTAAGSLRLVVHIVTFEDGMTATMDSPDQGAAGLPATSISRTGTKVQLTMKQLGGEFSGTLDAGLTTIDGLWSQLGNSLPLVLKRVKR